MSDPISSRLPAFDSLNAAARWAVDVAQSGRVVSPRGMQTFEIYNAGFQLTNPRARLLTIKKRGWNTALAVGEFCWHMKRATAVEPLAYYAPVWQRYSDDGQTIRGSCYGHKIFRDGTEGSQWERARNFLLYERDTRRAIIVVGGYDKETGINSLDVACLQSLHFFVRDGRLDLVTHMRSNDAFIGLPYDVFLFTMLQEMMSIEIGIPLGTYYHIANSLHLYERDLERARALRENPAVDVRMDPIINKEGLSELLDLEAKLRSGSESISLPPQAPWRNLGKVLMKFSEKKRGKAQLSAA